MAEIGTAWTKRGAWSGIVAPGSFGATGAGVKIGLCEGLGIASLIMAEEDRPALSRAVKDRFGLDLTSGPAVVWSESHKLVWAGPGQWLLLATSRPGFHADLGALSMVAAVADQSDGRAVMRLSGGGVRKALAKGCMVDLHPSAFPVGMTALSVIAYVGLQLWRLEDDAHGAVFEIMVPRSMAGSFWSWLCAAVAEFGCRVTD